MARYKVGIDVGGTFTDLCVIDEVTGQWSGFKTPTVPEDIAGGVLNALHGLRERGVEPADVDYFVHGTTIAVNTTIQRRGATCALLVTRGFRDTLELARLRMPSAWDYYSVRPTPLVPRERVIEVEERLLYTGEAEIALSEGAVEDVIDAVRASGVESVAICLLHSYANPAHELLLKAALEQNLPDVDVCCSADIWPQMREYERALATVMNAYVLPIMRRYIDDLESKLRDFGVGVNPYMTRSNGGIMSLRAARSHPVQTLMSGPASGVVGALEAGRSAGFTDLITFDLGGTSADVAVIERGAPAYSKEEHVGDFPLILPAIGISSIGAGGGSLAWVDGSGVLRVGPQSAGANPGPACYGLGGTEPALTDAFLVCGYLNPDNFAGTDRLDRGASEVVLARLTEALGLDAEGVADAMLRVALANMYPELSGVFDRRGLDPRDYTLVAFGGAGPVLACLLAEDINVRRVLVPLSPGTLCAYGALKADVMSDFIQSLRIEVNEDGITKMSDAADALRKQGLTWLREEAPPVADTSLLLSADMRYVGQSFELEVPLEEGWIRDGRRAAITGAFHKVHEQIYSHADPEAPVEVMNLRLRAVGTTPQHATAMEGGEVPPPAGPAVTRDVVIRGQRTVAKVLRRDSMRPGDELTGPAIIEQVDTTTVIPAGWNARVDPYRNLILTGAEAT